MIKSHLNLCPICGGTGNDPSDKKHKCVYCDGCRVMSHFIISYDVDVPYRSEDDIANKKRTMLHNIREMKRVLGVKY